jgi:uncharacterized tellurite resistance protein B-like protein
MAEPICTITLLKVLIGAAWIDGNVQPEERQYLRRLAEEQGLENNAELRPLLYELVQVKPEQCYQWVEDYLAEEKSPDSCHNLLEAISGLIYSDGTVEVEEARLLNRIQAIDSACGNGTTSAQRILTAVRKLYQNWLARIESMA